MTVYGGPDIITDGLVLHLDAGNRKSYPGSGSTWYDLSGNGYNGTFNGTTTFDSATKSMSFDSGDNTYISTSFNTAYTYITISVWFNAQTQDSNTGSVLRPIIMLGDFSQDGPLEISMLRPGISSANSIRFQIGYDNVSYTYTTSIAYNDQAWHNVVLVKNNNSMSVYSDGQHLSTQAGDTNNTYDRSSGLRIGGGTSITARRFLGRVSQVTVHNKVLSADEIRQNYNALKGRYGLT